MKITGNKPKESGSGDEKASREVILPKHLMCPIQQFIPNSIVNLNEDTRTV